MAGAGARWLCGQAGMDPTAVRGISRYRRRTGVVFAIPEYGCPFQTISTRNVTVQSAQYQNRQERWTAE